MPPTKQPAAKRKHEETANTKPPKMTKEEKAALRAKAAQAVQQRNAPVAATASAKTVSTKAAAVKTAAAPLKTVKSLLRKKQPVAAAVVAKKQQQQQEKQEPDSTDDEPEITSPTKKRRIGEHKSNVSANANASAPARVAPSAVLTTMSPKAEKKQKLAQARARAVAWQAEQQAEARASPFPPPNTSSSSSSRRMMASTTTTSGTKMTTSAATSTSATGTQQDRKPSYKTTTSATATAIPKKSHRMDDKMPFHSPKPQTGPELMGYSHSPGSMGMGMNMGLPSLPDPTPRVHVETVEDDDEEEEEEEEVYAYQQQAAAAAAQEAAAAPAGNVAAEPADKVVGKSEWRNAVVGFFLVLLVSFGISGLYETGVISGDVLGGGSGGGGSGVRSMMQSMEARLESGGDQAWMWWSSSSFIDSSGGAGATTAAATPAWRAWFSSSSSDEQQRQSAAQQTLPCFRDSPMANEDYYDVELVPHCADPHTVFRPCPKGAWCAGGALERCSRDNELFAVSAAGDQCVLSAASNATIQEFEQKLIEWTVTDGCTKKGCAYTAKRMHGNGNGNGGDAGFPLFYYTQLVGEFEGIEWNAKLLEVANAARFAATGKHVFFTMRENDNHLIGLHPDQYVPLPFSCVLKRGFFYLVATFAMSVWLIFKTVMAWLFDMVMDLFFVYPLVSTMVSLVGFSVLWMIYTIRSGQRNKQQLLVDVVDCRDKVCRILAADRQEHQTIHIRDEISFQVCPKSKMGRRRIQSAVWPRVVGDIRQDTRIHKRVVAVGAGAGGAGEKREYWKWVAPTDPAAAGHVRFTTSTGAAGAGAQNGQ